MITSDVSAALVVVAIIGSYGTGVVPGAVIVARRHGVDLHAVGDGNPGAWNALDQLGWRRAWPAFAIDGLKGFIAALIGWTVCGGNPLGITGGPLADATTAGAEDWVAWACVGAAMLGHAFPPWAPRSGGKSVMTFVGGAIGLVPLAALPLVALFLVAAAVGRAALGARLAVFAFPVVQAFVTPIEQVAWTGVLMTLIGLLFLVRRRPRDVG